MEYAITVAKKIIIGMSEYLSVGIRNCRKSIFEYVFVEIKKCWNIREYRNKELPKQKLETKRTASIIASIKMNDLLVTIDLLVFVICQMANKRHQIFQNQSQECNMENKYQSTLEKLLALQNACFCVTKTNHLNDVTHFKPMFYFCTP